MVHRSVAATLSTPSSRVPRDAIFRGELRPECSELPIAPASSALPPRHVPPVRKARAYTVGVRVEKIRQYAQPVGSFPSGLSWGIGRGARVVSRWLALPTNF
jgi:hypothetical protein